MRSAGQRRARRRVDGGILLPRSLAGVLRVRSKPRFHRDDHRKLGGGIQGPEYGGHFKFFASLESDLLPNATAFGSAHTLSPLFSQFETAPSTSHRGRRLQ